jgi:cytoskeletal protein CcmA (bactofilin family)
VWNRQQEEAEEEDSGSFEPQPPPVTTPNQPVSSRQTAVLGPSITIKGTLAGDEDLLIEGRVDGEISFQKHTVTIGKSGRVKADLKCKNIYVEGQVHGNLYGKEVVVIKASGKVNGNAVAPRVSLEDGCHFRGSIDMQPKSNSDGAEHRGNKSETSRTSSTTHKIDDGAKPKPVTAGQSA